MKRLLGVLFAVVLLAGCGGKKLDPGRKTLGAFVDAAGKGDLAKMRDLLSPEAYTALGAPGLRRLAARLRPIARSYRFIVSEEITDNFGLAAVRGGSRVYAAAL